VSSGLISATFVDVASGVTVSTQPLTKEEAERLLAAVAALRTSQIIQNEAPQNDGELL
jgi:hypothetical protein